MKTTRRLFLKRGGLALVSVGLAPTMGPLFLSNSVYADEPQRLPGAAGGRKVLVCLFQRGAVDGLSMAPPHGDPYYYQHRSVARGGIALAQQGEGSVIDLDGKFGLHPALAPLKPIYDSGHLTLVHACGSPNPTRSHFDAQDYMEAGDPDSKSIGEGWLARTIRACPEDTARRQMFRGVSVTPRVPRSLLGDPDALAIADLRTFGMKGAPAETAVQQQHEMQDARAIGADDVRPRPSMLEAFQSMYDQDSGDILHGPGQETFEALKIVRGLNAHGYTPANGAVYPAAGPGVALQQIAHLIKANVGVEVAFLETGGWDTHANQGGAQGRLANNLRQLGGALAAFYQDMGDHMADVVVLTMSEFGRTARQNGNGGTDHGHATCFLAMGGPVAGGSVRGLWPGLAPEQLYQNRDLAVTTDFRSVFGEVAQKHLGVRDLSTVFPDFNAAAGFRGVIRA